MANYYKGSEIKFSIQLTAEGFSMDDDDFDIEVVSPKGSVKGNKNNTTGTTDIIIFREPALPASDGDSSTGSVEEGAWYAIVNTAELGQGELRVMGTAYIPDANADDGIRTDIATATLGRLINL